ncbi:glycoside hydrolase [uncultured Algibacter sp.]|uniref:glycoside hydrolase family 117 protein n=1 Tax=uncultured Algibacter sp. TaxID=298659 RepID=UPI0026049F6E|nr:glycoside hydrolase [uncultured Algibacter sp.]
MSKIKYLVVMVASVGIISCGQQTDKNATKEDVKQEEQSLDSLKGYPWDIPQTKPDRPLSAANERLYDRYMAPRPQDNELFSQFKYTELKGFDYGKDDGTISRRDPSKIIKENGKFYVWYTHRQTVKPPVGFSNAHLSTDAIPSTDWDLADIWYATSKDGITWEEQGPAIKRPEKPALGWRSVTTTDILKWEGKYYLYFQAFSEASGTKGDHCPVAVAHSDSPDGPWAIVDQEIIPNGESGTWDQYSIHDPYPLVYKGKIYVYYKAAYGVRPEYLVAAGLAIADNPLGPFKKHPLNPLFNSGHETALFPFKEGIAALITRDGNENSTIQYAPDGVSFDIASVSAFLPFAAGSYIPDAFNSKGNGRGITWGISHFTGSQGYPEGRGRKYSYLARFDCDLSLDLDDPQMKDTRLYLHPEVYFSRKLSKKQMERIRKESE